jgi:hypothetical protein
VNLAFDENAGFSEKASPMASAPLPKMMLGFVIRRCAVALGRDPSPAEFAEWANTYSDGDRKVCLFGRPISEIEARVMLRHRARPVAARSAAPSEQLKEDVAGVAIARVTSISEVKARWQVAPRRKARIGRP